MTIENKEEEAAPYTTDDIDFDDASREWRKNKVRQSFGAFRYRCAHFSTTKQQLCKNKVNPKSDFCSYHCKMRTKAGI